MFRLSLERQYGALTEYSSVLASKWRCDSSGKYAIFDEDGSVVQVFDVGEVVSVEPVNG